MEIKIAKHAGFCFGVRRAVEMAERILEEKDQKVYCWGPLIHNPQVVERFEKKGLKVVTDINKIPRGSTFLVRSHGVSPDITKELLDRGVKIFDATCPFVKRAQLAAKNFYDKGYQVIICGDPNHAEIIGINGWAQNAALIVHDAGEISGKEISARVGVLSQTTQKFEVLKETVAALLPKAKYMAIENTICSDTETKQKEVGTLAKKVEVMVVIGGKSSSNTTKLAQLSRQSGASTYHIETAAELEKDWFATVAVVGIAAGASTAGFLIEEAVEKIKSFEK